MSALYNIAYEPDGVYLEINSQQGDGVNLEYNDFLGHLSRKKISSLNMKAVQRLNEQGEGRVQIAPAQAEFIYGEDLTISVGDNEMEAGVRLLAPERGGEVLALEKAKTKLQEAGIIHGVDESRLVEVLDKKDYGEPYVIAKATAPEDGEDGKLIFHFSTDERTGRPREIGHGRVDYRSLDLYVPVEEGQLLVSKTQPTEGMPGRSVRGMPIKQRPGKEVSLPRGKNTVVNEEKTEMAAAYAGMVEVISNVITVSNLYKISGDCDISVGNIDFDGSVQISGSVRSGHTVKATGSITVGGSVEGAALIAGGNVEVKGGMQGSGKGRIEAGGSVTIAYIEQGTIVADGPVKIDVSIHSIVETSSTLHALGKRGAVIGGKATAAGDIVANFIGALSNTKTEVEVGVMPRKRARIMVLEKELARLASDRIKLGQLDEYLNKSKATMPQERWEQLYESGIENRRINAEEETAFSEEIAGLRYDIEHATKSRVHVFQTAFSGSRISIGSSSFKVTDEISFATFRFSNGEVVYGPCEASR